MSIRPLSTIQDFDAVLRESVTRPVFLLKHSTACPISARAYGEFQQFAGRVAPTGAASFALVYVIEARPVAQAIAARLGVAHQSPQVILLHDGRAVWHASHYDVTAAAMAAAYSMVRS